MMQTNMTAQRRSGGLAAIAALAAIWFVTPAAAQNVVATVNDDPITNVDIAQHAKILSVLHKPASPQAALDDVIDTRLKLIETSKFKISPSQADIGWALGFPAREMKVDPQQLLAAFSRAGITSDQIEQKYKAEAAWLMYIRALNRTLEVSENEVNAELARRGGGKAAIYSIRQVIFVVPGGAGAAVLESRFKSAGALRSQFTSCDSGEALVRSAPDAVIQPPVSRTAAALPAQLKQILDHTEIGHLTPPSRGAEGIVMLALCSRVERDDSDAAESVRNELLSKRMIGVSDQKFAELKSRAIIVKK